MRLALALSALIVLGAAGAAGERDPIADLARVPYLAPGERHDYTRFLDRDLPRAFAISPDGHHAFAAQAFGSEELTRQRALFYCRAAGGKDCRLYAVDLDVVWPGQEWAAPHPPEFVGDASLHPDPDYLWHAPPAAGVFVWLGAGPLPGFARMYNNAGFDVVRTSDAAHVGNLHGAGFARVVLGGYGEDAGRAIDAAAQADAVIAISPRVETPVPRAPRTRLAVLQFAGGAANPDAVRQAALAAKPMLAHLLLLDRPEGFDGDEAGLGTSFTGYFGTCLLRFGISEHPPGAC